MSRQGNTGPGSQFDLLLSPKKPKIHDNRFDSSPVRFDRRISDVLQSSSPRAAPAQPAVPENREIADSDEDDDDDGDEFPDLSTLLKITGKTTSLKRVVPMKPTLFESDEKSDAKKRAEFKAYMREIREADEIDRLEKATSSMVNGGLKRDSSDKLEGKALFDQAVDNVKDEEGDASDKEQNLTRVRQAMNRQASTGGAPTYHFFAPPEDDESPFPNVSSDLDLTIEEKGHQFSLAIQSKLINKYLDTSPGISLPDELLDWILDVYPRERSEAVRMEFLEVLTHDSDQLQQQVSRLFTKRRLEQLFIRAGADDAAVDLAERIKNGGRHHGRQNQRNWAPFLNLLELLRACSHRLGVDILIQAAVLLLRASMDDELRLQASAAAAVHDTLSCLVSVCSKTERDRFCGKVCNLFVQTVDSISLLCRALDATRHCDHNLLTGLDPDQLPEAFDPFEDLHTRLLLSVFFGSADLATRERCGTAPLLLQAILQRLDEPHLKSSRDRNYHDLDAYGVALTEILPFLHSLRQLLTEKSEITAFNRSIDDLRRRIGFLTSTIPMSGPMNDVDAKHSAKTHWQALLDYRLAYLFPRPGGEGIFGHEPTAEEIEEEGRRIEKRNSQRFLADFLHKKRVSNR